MIGRFLFLVSSRLVRRRVLPLLSRLQYEGILSIGLVLCWVLPQRPRRVLYLMYLSLMRLEDESIVLIFATCSVSVLSIAEEQIDGLELELLLRLRIIS